MITRALSFGADADAYERHRPGYPDSIIDRVLDYAEVPIRTALEVGAGTGKATRLVASRGITVLASEPDPRMLTVLRSRTADLPVTEILGSFEDLSATTLPEPVQLLFAAAAFHWTDPATRWSRAAELLPIGGTAAFFGGELELADPTVRERFNAVIGDGADHRSGLCQPANQEGWQWPASELVADHRFAELEQHRIPRRLRLSLDDFISHIGTQSRFLIIDAAERESIFTRAREVLPAEIDFDGDLVLHLARRVTPR